MEQVDEPTEVIFQAQADVESGWRSPARPSEQRVLKKSPFSTRKREAFDLYSNRAQPAMIIAACFLFVGADPTKRKHAAVIIAGRPLLLSRPNASCFLVENEKLIQNARLQGPVSYTHLTLPTKA